MTPNPDTRPDTHPESTPEADPRVVPHTAEAIAAAETTLGGRLGELTSGILSSDHTGVAIGPFTSSEVVAGPGVWIARRFGVRRRTRRLAHEAVDRYLTLAARGRRPDGRR